MHEFGSDKYIAQTNSETNSDSDYCQRKENFNAKTVLRVVDFKHCFGGNLIWQQEGYYQIKFLAGRDQSISAFGAVLSFFGTFFVAKLEFHIFFGGYYREKKTYRNLGHQVVLLAFIQVTS